MNTVLSIAKREIRGYICTPIAYVFLVTFLAMTTVATFLVGDFFAFNEASLRTLFFWLPWLFLLFVPAAGMRLWAEEPWKYFSPCRLRHAKPFSASFLQDGSFWAWGCC